MKTFLILCALSILAAYCFAGDLAEDLVLDCPNPTTNKLTSKVDCHAPIVSKELVNVSDIRILRDKIKELEKRVEKLELINHCKGDYVGGECFNYWPMGLPDDGCEAWIIDGQGKIVSHCKEKE